MADVELLKQTIKRKEESIRVQNGIIARLEETIRLKEDLIRLHKEALNDLRLRFKQLMEE
jgi:hypothetical protein